MEEYNINFKEILDKLSLEELCTFSDKLVDYRDRRLEQELLTHKERFTFLHNLRNKITSEKG